MKKIIVLFVCWLSFLQPAQSQVKEAYSKDEIAIRQLMDNQTAAWNRGDITAFMKGYWQNDALMFVGKSGVTYGWQNTLDNYKKGYPDTAAMGQLQFT
ncbi:MAG: hypothetical protein KDB92_06630, partial [Chitinophagaceae bacterium]|nr:hypothetical protein [Chitinophagaceae bacterium]